MLLSHCLGGDLGCGEWNYCRQFHLVVGGESDPLRLIASYSTIICLSKSSLYAVCICDIGIHCFGFVDLNLIMVEQMKQYL